MTDLQVSEVARGINREALVVDTVNRSVLDEQFLADAHEGGVNVLGRTILVSSSDVFSPFGFLETLREITEVLSFVDQHPDRLMLVRSGEDTRRAHETSRTGFYIYFQSPEPIGNQLWRLRLFHELGLRVLQLTYNQRSLLGDGCAELTDAGLSDLGREVVNQCNDLGIAIDVSHCGYSTAIEAMEISADPVLLTHANARELVDNRRNKTEEQAKLCASKGGVIGVMSLPAFLRRDPSHTPTVLDMFDHIDHYVELVGADHVGLGLDLTTGHEHDDFSLLGYKKEMYENVWVDGVQQYLPGMAALSDLPSITQGLLDRGYAEDDIQKILGGNFARVLAQIWDRPTDGEAN